MTWSPSALRPLPTSPTICKRSVSSSHGVLPGAKSRGQPPIAFELNPNAGNSIGISLEPGRVSAGLVNLVGEILERRAVDVDTHDQRRALTSILALIRELRRRPAASERVWGVGVALPGPLVKTDISFVGPTALEGWTDLSIFDELREATHLQVFYNVDSVAAALGETLFGVARSLDTFFYMHFGVGLGGTLVVNRSAYRGANGNATEIGHIPVVPGGKACYCGNAGCLERYLSLHSLAEALGVSDATDRDAANSRRSFSATPIRRCWPGVVMQPTGCATRSVSSRTSSIQ